MGLRGFALAALIFPTVASAADCPVEGELIWWAADVCMARLETDDEIAAAGCIQDEMARHPRSSCDDKRSLKQALCSLSIARGTRRGDLEACVADPAFRGPTVRNRGVGGGR